MALMEYKGYFGTAEVSLEDGCLAGHVLYVKDKIVYFGETLSELRDSFHSAVDDYLDFCIKVGKSPDKSFSGTLNVRLGQELHRKVAIKSQAKGVAINEWIKQACEDYAEHEGVHEKSVSIHVHHTPGESVRRTVPVKIIEPSSVAGKKEDLVWKKQRETIH